jgi:hypothetical protein
MHRPLIVLCSLLLCLPSSLQAHPFTAAGAEVWSEKIDFLWISAQMEGSPIKNLGRGCNGMGMDIGRHSGGIPDWAGDSVNAFCNAIFTMDGRANHNICDQLNRSLSLIRNSDVADEPEEIKLAAAKLMALSETVLESMTRTGKCA